MIKILAAAMLVLSLTACGTLCVLDKGYDAELSGFEYPFNVKRFKFSSQKQSLQMSFGDLGAKDSKKVAVLLHGKNFAGFYFDKIAKELVAKGYRVIIPDQIGFGKSSKPKNYQFSFQQLALNTRKLLAHLNIDQYTLVGHSMGGMLSVHLSVMSPKVKKLILVNPIGLEDYLRFVEYQDPEFFYEKEVAKTVDMFRNYQKKNYYDGKWSDSYEDLLEPFKGWRKGPDWELVAWNNALTYEPIFGDEIVSKIPLLKIKTHLILGTRDRTGPGRGWKKPGVDKKLGLYQNLGNEIKALNPKNIKLIELKGLGHMPQFEDYEAFSKVFYPLF